MRVARYEARFEIWLTENEYQVLNEIKKGRDECQWQALVHLANINLPDFFLLIRAVEDVQISESLDAVYANFIKLDKKYRRAGYAYRANISPKQYPLVAKIHDFCLEKVEVSTTTEPYCLRSVSRFNFRSLGNSHRSAKTKHNKSKLLAQVQVDVQVLKRAVATINEARNIYGESLVLSFDDAGDLKALIEF